MCSLLAALDQRDSANRRLARYSCSAAICILWSFIEAVVSGVRKVYCHQADHPKIYLKHSSKRWFPVFWGSSCVTVLVLKHTARPLIGTIFVRNRRPELTACRYVGTRLDTERREVEKGDGSHSKSHRWFPKLQTFERSPLGVWVSYVYLRTEFYLFCMIITFKGYGKS